MHEEGCKGWQPEVLLASAICDCRYRDCNIPEDSSSQPHAQQVISREDAAFRLSRAILPAPGYSLLRGPFRPGCICHPLLERWLPSTPIQNTTRRQECRRCETHWASAATAPLIPITSSSARAAAAILPSTNTHDNFCRGGRRRPLSQHMVSLLNGTSGHTSMRCGERARPRMEPVYMPEYTRARDLERSRTGTHLQHTIRPSFPCFCLNRERPSMPPCNL
jgi:hypothetical protein